MKKILSVFLMIACTFSHAFANDGVYYTSGNFLVPVSETDISVAKEILTITIGKDSLATVDVYYEFENPQKTKTVIMAFEATPPFNAWEPKNRNGEHPYIKDFTATMNGKKLNYSNSLVDTQYNPSLDKTISYSYAYYFKAQFEQGKNIVHHTYSYKMSYNIGERFIIPYWLTPATRWANKQVDDFTLRIKSEEYTEFCIDDNLFSQAEFTSSKGNKLYRIKTKDDEKVVFGCISDDEVIEWHAKNFHPKTDMIIKSPMWGSMSPFTSWTTIGDVVIDAKGGISRYVGECGNNYLIEVQDYGLVPKKGAKVVEYNAKNGQGWVLPRVEENKTINVMRQPSENSEIIDKIEVVEGDMPEVFECKGLVDDTNGNVDQWFIIEINGKKGYVNKMEMKWDAVNSY